MNDNEKKQVKELILSGVSPEGAASYIQRTRERTQAFTESRSPYFEVDDPSLLSQLKGAAGEAFGGGLVRRTKEDFGRAFDGEGGISGRDVVGGLAATAKIPFNAVAGLGQGVGEAGFGLLETADDLTGEVISRNVTEPLVEATVGSERGQAILGGAAALDERFLGGAGADVLNFGFGAGSLVKRGVVVDAAKKIPTKVPQSLKEIIEEGKVGNIIEPKQAPEKIATEVLQPSNAVTKNTLSQGRTPEQVDFLVNNIDELQGAKSYDELITKIDDILDVQQKEVRSRIKANDFDLDDNFLLPLLQKMDDLEKDPSVRSTDVKAHKEVFDNYSKFMANKGVITRSDAQSLKEQLNKTTEPLQKKKEAGNITGNENSRLQALDMVRKGLKEAVEDSDKVIRDLNLQYGAGRDAIRSLSTRLANANKAITPSFVQRVLMPLIELLSSTTGAGSAAFVARRAAQAQDSLEKSLRKISASSRQQRKKSAIPDKSKSKKVKKKKDGEDDEKSKETDDG